LFALECADGGNTMRRMGLSGAKVKRKTCCGEEVGDAGPDLNLGLASYCLRPQYH